MFNNQILTIDILLKYINYDNKRVNKNNILNIIGYNNINEYLNKINNFVKNYHENINWKELSKYKYLPLIIIEHNEINIYWDNISKYNELIIKDVKFMKKFKHKINWNKLSKRRYLNDNILNNY